MAQRALEHLSAVPAEIVNHYLAQISGIPASQRAAGAAENANALALAVIRHDSGRLFTRLLIYARLFSQVAARDVPERLRPLRAACGRMVPLMAANDGGAPSVEVSAEYLRAVGALDLAESSDRHLAGCVFDCYVWLLERVHSPPARIREMGELLKVVGGWQEAQRVAFGFTPADTVAVLRRLVRGASANAEVSVTEYRALLTDAESLPLMHCALAAGVWTWLLSDIHGLPHPLLVCGGGQEIGVGPADVARFDSAPDLIGRPTEPVINAMIRAYLADVSTAQRNNAALPVGFHPQFMWAIDQVARWLSSNEETGTSGSLFYNMAALLCTVVRPDRRPVLAFRANQWTATLAGEFLRRLHRTAREDYPPNPHPDMAADYVRYREYASACLEYAAERLYAMDRLVQSDTCLVAWLLANVFCDHLDLLMRAMPAAAFASLRLDDVPALEQRSLEFVPGKRAIVFVTVRFKIVQAAMTALVAANRRRAGRWPGRGLNPPPHITKLVGWMAQPGV